MSTTNSLCLHCNQWVTDPHTCTVADATLIPYPPLNPYPQPWNPPPVQPWNPWNPAPPTPWYPVQPVEESTKPPVTTVSGTSYLQVLPPMYKVLNNFVATEPFENVGIEKTGQTSGFMVAKQKTALIPLKVVWGNGEIEEGQTVFVRGDLAVQDEGKRIYEVEGKRIIFIPMSEVRILRRYTLPENK